MKSIRKYAALGAVLGMAVPACVWAVSGFDSAADPVYDDGWGFGDNGGTGLTAWSFLTGTDRVYVAASSTTNGNGDTNTDGDIDTAGRAWGHGGALPSTTTLVQRAFTTGISTPGSQVLVKMDTGHTANWSFAIINTSYTPLTNIGMTGGNYSISDGTGANFDTGVPFSDEGLILIYTYGATAGTYSLEIQRLEGGGPYTFGPRSLLSTDPFGGVRATNLEGSSDSTRMMYMNSIVYSSDGGLPVELDSFGIE